MHPNYTRSTECYQMRIDADDYHRIVSEYNDLLMDTRVSANEALLTYIHDFTSDREDRRRAMLGNYFLHIRSWREMCNFCEVALASGEMLNFPPLCEHIILRQWNNPYMTPIAPCQFELDTLVDFASLTIDAASLRIRRDLLLRNYYY